MRQPIGDIIRHVRRMRNLTQSELGGDRFSKSYVSAIEHNKIAPSSEVLHFFAERLGYPTDYFERVLEHPEAVKSLSALDTLAHPDLNGQATGDDTIALLNMLLEHSEFSHLAVHPNLPVLSSEIIAAFPHHVQARYYFVLGLNAKEQGNLSAALGAFASALALAPAHQQAAILDEIGNCYFLLQAFHAALAYSLHALQVLPKEPRPRVSTSLRLKVELHCGDAYRALGAYQEALAHYEEARLHLKAEHNVETAGRLYLGLGYCTNAIIYPATVISSPSDMQGGTTPEEIEHEFQRAFSFLLQSRSFYQVIGDYLREANVRLMLASTQLDLSTWQRRMISNQARTKQLLTRCITLLEDAADQCRQVLLGWQALSEQEGEIHLTPTTPPGQLDTLTYRALAYLIRISVQRAALARMEGSSIDIAYRERALAADLCQQVFNTLTDSSLLLAVINQALYLSAETIVYRTPALPRLTNSLTATQDTFPRSPTSLFEVYFAAAEVAEELGRMTTVQNYAHDCYVQANQYFEAALALESSVVLSGEQDPGYLARLYQRVIALLEERTLATPAFYEETTRALAGFLKNGLWQYQHPVREKKMPSQDLNEAT